MTDRTLISSGSTWEPVIGYSRAVKVGDVVHVSGTVGTEADGTVSPDAEAQAARSIAIIEAALEQAGATLADVVRTRIYLTDMAHFDAVARAHGAAFGEVRPATVILQVAALVDPAYVVEIEAEAVI
jgi:enamine deaminase RidA (YjgF/YER057c/UK114 family)